MPFRESMMHVEVGSYEAKTKLPVHQKKISDAAAAVNQMRAFVRSRNPMPGLDLKALVNEGRA